MAKLKVNILSTVFLIDAIFAIGFGLYSWFSPYETYGSIITFPQSDPSAFLSILSTLSLFYFLIGLVGLVGFKSSYPINIWIGLIMLTRHFLEGVLKVIDMNSEWLIGNPYTDIVIHSFFIVAYIVGIFLSYRIRPLIKK